MNALTFRALRRERIREFFAALSDNAGAALFLAAVLVLMLTVGGMEYADAIRLEGMR